MTLAAIQADFSKWLRSADGEAANRLGPQTAPGLAVYLNTHRAQLMSCLEESYPQTVKWLGAAAFRQAAAHHIDDFPPTGWTLDAYPARFPQTLAALYADNREVAELAKLELALSDAFCASDARPVEPCDIATIDWSSAPLRLMPGAQVIAFSSNAPEIWSSLSHGHPDPPTARPETSGIVVWRSGFQCRFRALEADEMTILGALNEEKLLERICEQLAHSLDADTTVARVGVLLARWASDQLLRHPTEHIRI